MADVEIYSFFFGSMGATAAMVFSALGAAYGTGALFPEVLEAGVFEQWSFFSSGFLFREFGQKSIMSRQFSR